MHRNPHGPAPDDQPDPKIDPALNAMTWAASSRPARHTNDPNTIRKAPNKGERVKRQAKVMFLYTPVRRVGLTMTLVSSRTSRTTPSSIRLRDAGKPFQANTRPLPLPRRRPHPGHGPPLRQSDRGDPTMTTPKDHTVRIRLIGTEADVRFWLDLLDQLAAIDDV